MKKGLKTFKIFEDRISTFLSVVIVVLVFGLLFNYFRSVNEANKGKTTPEAAKTIIQQENKTPKQVAEEGLPAQYTVKPGDSLWKISQEAYGTGYKWQAVYEANKDKIKNPGILLAGVEITLPKVDIETVSYTVQKGDSLWGISENLCENGYAWQRIAVDNGLANPGLITPGQKLTIICKL